MGPATARLFQAHGEEVWRFLKYLGVREHDLADACQEVFLVAHRAFKNLPAGAYEIRAEVLSATEVRAMATDALMVLGAGNR